MPVPLSRISSARLDLIASQLTPTEKAVIELLARSRLCSAAQLQQLFWNDGSESGRGRQARRTLARLTQRRLLERLPRMIGGRRAGSRGFIYTIGPAAVRLLARNHGQRARRLSAPGDRYINHTLAITGLYTDLTLTARDGHADLFAFDFEPACWAGYPGAWGRTLTLKPDAAVRVGIGEYEYSWLVEIDMATESLPTIHGKGQRHLDYHRSGEARRQHGISPRVLWITPDTERAERIHTALAKLGEQAGRLFAITTAADAIRLLTSEARS